MNIQAFSLVVWSPWYVLPTAIGCLLAYRASNTRPTLGVGDWLLFFVPWFVWFGAMLFNSHHKSLANLAELYVLVAVAIGGFALRLRYGPRVGHNKASLAVLGLTCLTAIALAAFVPALPE